MCGVFMCMCGMSMCVHVCVFVWCVCLCTCVVCLCVGMCVCLCACNNCERGQVPDRKLQGSHMGSCNGEKHKTELHCGCIINIVW